MLNEEEIKKLIVFYNQNLLPKWRVRYKKEIGLISRALVKASASSEIGKFFIETILAIPNFRIKIYTPEGFKETFIGGDNFHAVYAENSINYKLDSKIFPETLDSLSRNIIHEFTHAYFSVIKMSKGKEAIMSPYAEPCSFCDKEEIEQYYKTVDIGHKRVRAILDRYFEEGSTKFSKNYPEFNKKLKEALAKYIALEESSPVDCRSKLFLKVESTLKERPTYELQDDNKRSYSIVEAKNFAPEADACIFIVRLNPKIKNMLLNLEFFERSDWKPQYTKDKYLTEHIAYLLEANSMIALFYPELLIYLAKIHQRNCKVPDRHFQLAENAMDSILSEATSMMKILTSEFKEIPSEILGEKILLSSFIPLAENKEGTKSRIVNDASGLYFLSFGISSLMDNMVSLFLSRDTPQELTDFSGEEANGPIDNVVTTTHPTATMVGLSVLATGALSLATYSFFRYLNKPQIAPTTPIPEDTSRKRKGKR